MTARFGTGVVARESQGTQAYWRFDPRAGRTMMSTLLLLLLLLLSALSSAAQGPESTSEPVVIDGVNATALVTDPATDAAVAVIAGDGLYRADGGAWQRIGDAPTGERVIADSMNETTLWAGSMLDCYRGIDPSAPLLRSDDGGATWVESGGVDLAPMVAWGDLVLAADCSGLNVSTDGGATFALVEALPLGMQATSFAVEMAPEGGTGPVMLVGLTGEGGTSYLYRVDLTDGALPTATDTGLFWYGIAPIVVGDDGDVRIGAAHGVLTEVDGAWEVSREGLERTTLAEDPLEVFPPDIEPGSFGLTALLDVDGALLAGGIDGVYRWDDTAWTSIVELTEPTVAMAIGADGTTLLVLTETQVIEVPEAVAES